MDDRPTGTDVRIIITAGLHSVLLIKCIVHLYAPLIIIFSSCKSYLILHIGIDNYLDYALSYMCDSYNYSTTYIWFSDYFLRTYVCIVPISSNFCYNLCVCKFCNLVQKNVLQELLD